MGKKTSITLHSRKDEKDTYYTQPGYEGEVVVTCSYCMGQWTLPKGFLGEFACGSCGRYMSIKDGKEKIKKAVNSYLEEN